MDYFGIKKMREAILRFIVVEHGLNSELFWSLSRKEAKEWMLANRGNGQGKGGFRSIVGEYTNLVTLI